MPPELADQIAAGEVVERPASVVKELVENALDAGARRIDIDVEGGGRRLVRVVDDGGGMTLTEARLALRRHATSKLEKLSDLFNIATMGFRGEALPSIAAVSRFSVTTRTPDEAAAWRLDVEAGVERDARQVGAAPGTQIEVRDLLWNVPARLKFMKAEPTEAGHVTEAVMRLALAHPEVGFRLRHGGRVAVDLPPHASLGDRVRAVVGRRLAARLLEGEADEAGIHVRLFLAPPDEAQTTSRGVQLYVGRRFVRDRSLLHAVGMGYGELVPHGRYPTAIVLLDPPAGGVDVNVHPQKVEVRFARPQEVIAAVRHAVARVLAGAPWLAENAGATPAPVSMYAVAQMAPPLTLSDVAVRYADRQEELLGGYRPSASPSPSQSPSPSHSPSPSPPPTQAAEGFFGRLAYLGQLDRTYLLCEAAGELILIDQHAAHERIAFQRLREAHRTSGPRTQRLLFPRTVELTPAQATAAADNAAALASIGFELEPFSSDFLFALRASPAELTEAEVVPTLRDLLADLADRDAS
ncbi:MAG TPA: DNA mismatch repair endonuclease MutL, partial [Planctomycetota bacterium]|nr:DNA mismatch repair endonuclease MutL [Planctomycetota bacterium]